MHTEPLPSPHQPALAVFALLLLGGTDLFGNGAALTTAVLPLAPLHEAPLDVPAAEEAERLAA